MSDTLIKDLLQVKKDPIDFWCDLIQEDLHAISDMAQLKSILYRLRHDELLKWITIDNKGIFAYLIAPSLTGGKSLNEVVFYIRPEFRSIKLMLQLIHKAEQIAEDNCCKDIIIGNGMMYKSESYFKVLNRLGYQTSSVQKKIRE